MENEFKAVMSQRTNAELIAILNSNDGDYKPDALAAAKKELERRSLSEVQLAEAKVIIEKQNIVTDSQSKKSLGAIWKVLAFVFPGIIQIIFIAIFQFNGYNKKSKDLLRWTLYGIAFYFVVFILAFAFA